MVKAMATSVGARATPLRAVAMAGLARHPGNRLPRLDLDRGAEGAFYRETT